MHNTMTDEEKMLKIEDVMLLCNYQFFYMNPADTDLLTGT